MAWAAYHGELIHTGLAATGPVVVAVVVVVVASFVVARAAAVEIAAVEAPGAVALIVAVGGRAAADNFGVVLDSEEWPVAA